MADKNQIEGGPKLTRDPAPVRDYSGISQESPNDQKLDEKKLAQSGYTLPKSTEPKTLQQLNEEADKRQAEEQKAASGPSENKSAKK